MKTLIILVIIFSLLVLWADFFFSSGVLYFLDSIFYPVYKFDWFFEQTLFWHIYNFLQYFFWFEIFSKIYFLITLLFWALFWIKVSGFLLKKFLLDWEKNKILFYFISIVFSTVFPFFYERIITQTWIALWTYFLWIWFVYLLEYLEELKSKKLYISSLYFAFAFSSFPHSIVSIIIIFLLTSAFFYKKFSLKHFFVAAFIFAIFNLNWIIWYFFLNKDLGSINTIWAFDFANIEAFTQASLWFLWVELTSFFGFWFWWEKYWHLHIPNASLIWLLSAVIVFLIIVLWFYNIWKKDKKLAKYFLTIYIIFFVLWMWISSPLFAWFNKILYEYIPYYIGMREPWKFFWIVAILNIIFFVVWVYFLSEILFKKGKLDIQKTNFDFYIYLSVIFILINIYSPWVLLWFRGQLQVTNYPQEYFESKKILEERGEPKNLILPWHKYMACKWGTNKISSNIYPYILWSSDAIAADNIEIWSVYSNSNNPVSKKIEEFIETKNLAILRELWVQNIIFQDFCWFYEKYDFLKKLDWLEKIFDREFLKIYKIK